LYALILPGRLLAAQPLGDLRDVLFVDVRSVEGWGRVQVRQLAALGRAVLDLTVAAVDSRDPVPDIPYLLVVFGAEAVQDAVEALVDVLPGVRKVVVRLSATGGSFVTSVPATVSCPPLPSLYWQRRRRGGSNLPPRLRFTP
jgi:hypothetical protein